MAIDNVTLTDNELLTYIKNTIPYYMHYATLDMTKTEEILSLFTGPEITSGDTRVFRFLINLAEVEDFDPKASNLLSNYKYPDVHEESLKLDTFKKIRLDINSTMFKMAMLSENGLTAFLGYLTGQLLVVKQDYLFNRLLIDWGKLATGNGTQLQSSQTISVKWQDSSGASSAVEADAIDRRNYMGFYNAVGQTSNNLTVLSNVYNSVKSYQSLGKDKFAFLMFDPYYTNSLLYFYATTFNPSYNKFGSDIPDVHVIPQIKIEQLKNGALLNYPSEKIDMTNIIGLLMFKKSTQLSYGYNISTSFFNAENLNLSYYSHFGFGCKILEHLPFIVFTK